MANENVKIIIQEVDETKPQGSGTSSDIVYIPGLAVERWATKWDENGNPIESEYKRVDGLDDYGNVIEGQEATIQNENNETVWNENAPYWEPLKNKPMLCNTVAEFEYYFGNEPYKMTEDDVNGTYIDNYHVGDYDKSYIYAKELLNQGMSVIYEYIASDAKVKTVGNISLVNVKAVEVDENGNPVIEETVPGVDAHDGSTPPTGTTEYKTYIIEDLSQCNLADNKNNTFTYTTQCEHIYDEYVYNFQIKLSKTLSPYAGSVKLVSDIPSFEGLAATIGNIKVMMGTDDVTNGLKTTSTGDTSSKTLVVNQDDRTIEWVGLSQSELDSLNITFSIHSTYEGKLSGVTTVWKLSVIESKVDIDGVESIGTASKITYLYDNLNASLDRIEDKSEYSVKYITSGGYPSFIQTPTYDGTMAYVLPTLLLDCAGNRGDAVALIDHEDAPEFSLLYQDSSSIYYKANEALQSANYAEFGTMFTPWARYNCSTIDKIEYMSQWMPASFGYLMCMAKAIKTSPNWLAMAGVTRGLVPNITEMHTGNNILTNVIAEDYQPKYGSPKNLISVNAITNIKPYGLTIWGNRTLKKVDPKGTTAVNFLNIRNMVSDIKKLAYSTAKSLMFEQDSDTLWLRFKSGISPLLEQLKSGYGISDYKIIRGTTKYNGKALTKGELAAVIRIIPRYAIEYFEITVVLADDDVVVS